MINVASSATLTSGTAYVFTDSTDITDGARKRICENIIYSQDPKDLPLRDLFGGYEKLKVESTKIEHVEDNHPPLVGTIGATGSSGTAGGSTWNLTTTVASLPVTDGDVFRTGDVILTEMGELLVVASISSNTITVYGRGDLGSSESVANTDGDDLYIVGNAQLEGYTYGADVRFYTKPSKVNYTQIFSDTISVSESYELIPKFGIPKESQHQLKMKQLRLAKLLERAVLYGNPNTGTLEGSTTHPRTMGGIIGKGSTATYPNIQTNTTSLSNAELTETNLKSEMQGIFDAGGDPNTIIVNSFNKGVISDFLTPYRRAEFDDKKYGGVVSKYETDFGICDIVLDRYMMPSDVVIMDKSMFSIGAYRPFKVKDLPQTTDNVKMEIVGEFSCMLHNEEHAALIYSTSTS